MKNLLFVLVLLPGLAFGSELCRMMGGTCRDACSPDEYAETGVFEDCGEKQECCVQKTPIKKKQDMRDPGTAGQMPEEHSKGNPAKQP